MNQQIKFLLMTVMVFSFITLALSVGGIGYQDTGEMNENVNYKAIVCVSTSGEFEGRESPAHSGINELIQCEHNVLTNVGRNATRELIGASNGAAFDYIQLGNAATGGTVVAATDTALDSNHSADGLQLAQGAYAVDNGNGNWSISKTFTAGTDTMLTNKTGLFNDTDWDKVMLAVNTFTLATLMTTDTITINWSINIV